MSTRRLTVPEFLILHRFWEQLVGSSGLPRWRHDMLASVPPELLPSLIVAEGCESAEHAAYRYVGEHCARRFGANPTGRLVAATLASDYRRYIFSLIADAEERESPIFSASLYRVDGALPVVTGRLFAPFRGAGRGELVMVSVQLFTESEEPLSAYSRSGEVEEIERKLVRRGTSALLGQAAQARQLARSARDPDVAAEQAARAERLEAEATRPLKLLDERH